MESEIITEAQETLGVAQPVSQPPIREVVHHFSMSPVYMGLKIVADYDKEAQQYEQARPGIVLIIGGKPVWVPPEASLMKSWGRFMIELGTLLEEIEIPREEIDIEAIKARIMACPGVRTDA